jgi:hypothetical protein
VYLRERTKGAKLKPKGARKKIKRISKKPLTKNLKYGTI